MILSDEEKKIIKRLKSVAKKWPNTLWLYSASGSLCIMKKKNGQSVMTKDGYVDSDYLVDKIDLENDGGDW